MITKEQREQIAGRETRNLRFFSGDVYARQPDHSVCAIDPDGNIRKGEDWPTRGVSLEEAEAIQRNINECVG